MREKLGRAGEAADTISSLQVKVQTWPTPRSEDSESCGNHPGAMDSLTGATRNWTTPTDTERSGQGERNKSLRLDAAQWKTPHGMNGGRTLKPEEIAAKGKTENGKRQVCLENEVRNWATPNARDDRNPSQPEGVRSIRKREQGRTVDLNEQAAWWETPQAHDSNGGSQERVGRFGTEHGGRNLADDVTAWPTPNACDGSKVSQNSHQGACLTRSAEAEFRYSHPDQATLTHGGASSPSAPTSRRRLNPSFVEWLMGWPLGWTDFAPLEMESWRSKARRHLHSWLRERD
jgi:hypothetical protein